RTPGGEAQQHLPRPGQPHAVAGQGFGLAVGGRLDEPQRLAAAPGMQGRECQARPPYLVEVPQRPIGLLRAEPDQPIALFFFNWYCPSGLLIQPLARFQAIPRANSAWRIVSYDTCLSVSPCSKATSARVVSVHSERGLPKARGGWRMSACRRSRAAPSRLRSGSLGPIGARCRHPMPLRLKPWMTLRTDCTLQPRAAAIWRGI